MKPTIHIFKQASMRLKHFFRGMGTVLEIMPPKLPKMQRRRFSSDTEALRSDWEKIGADFRRAFEQAEQQAPTE